MAIYDIHWQAPLVVGTTVDRGQALVPNSSGNYVVATAANRTLYGRAAGVCLVGASSESPAPMAVTGIVSADVTGLGTGSVSWVRVDANGSLERCTPSGSDDVVGYCRTDGTLHALFGVLTVSLINGGGSVPAAGVVKSDGLAYSSSDVDLTTEVTGVLPYANGGTGLSALGTPLYVLRTNAGGNAMEWAADSGFTAGGDLSGTSTSQTVEKVKGTTITTAGGALPVGAVLRTTAVGTADWGTLDLADADARTGTLPYGNGGTGLSALGSPLQVLRTNAGANAIEWATVAAGAASSGATGTVQLSDGAGGFTAATRVLGGADFISFDTAGGVQAATSGNIRFDNNQGEILFRNNADTLNLAAIKAYNNSIAIGDANIEELFYRVKTGYGHDLQVNGVSKLYVADAATTVGSTTLVRGNSILGSNYISFDATTASTGKVRLGGTGDVSQIVWYDSSADRALITTSTTGNGTTFGYAAATTALYGSSCTVYSASASTYLYGAGGQQAKYDGSTVQVASPQIGLVTAHGAVDGLVRIQTSNGTTNLTNTQYCYKHIELYDGTQTSTQTLGGFPHPASDAASYSKYIMNRCANGNAHNTVSTGTGGTITIAPGFGAWLLFSNQHGVTRMTADTAITP